MRVLCVLRVCVRADSERWRGEETSGESRSLRSATIVVEHLRESGARREEEKNGYHVECCRSIRTKRRACVECDTVAGRFEGLRTFVFRS